MTDKELLELAAKAAGYTLEEHYDDDQYYPWCTETLDFWNPLRDDGDALRLMVKLEIDIWVCEEKIAVAEYGLNGFCIGRCNEWLNDDPYAATRRAIVRAAAEIWREIESSDNSESDPVHLGKPDESELNYDKDNVS